MIYRMWTQTNNLFQAWFSVLSLLGYSLVASSSSSFEKAGNLIRHCGETKYEDLVHTTKFVALVWPAA